MWILLFPFLVHAAEWKKSWELALDAKPRAAFFSVAEDAVLLSVEKKEAEMLKISSDGKKREEFLIRKKGAAGPIRAYGDRLYWAVGDKVSSFTLSGAGVKEEGRAHFVIEDLALNRKGEIEVAGAGGVARLGEKKAIPSPAVTGLFQGQDTLYVLQEGKTLLAIPGSSRPLCSGGCRGLERASDGSWVTVQGNDVIRVGKGREVLVAGKSPPGRIAYVYRRETKDDLIIVPYPDERVVRAFRAP